MPSGVTTTTRSPSLVTVAGTTRPSASSWPLRCCSLMPPSCPTPPRRPAASELGAEVVALATVSAPSSGRPRRGSGVDIDCRYTYRLSLLSKIDTQDDLRSPPWTNHTDRRRPPGGAGQGPAWRSTGPTAGAWSGCWACSRPSRSSAGWSCPGAALGRAVRPCRPRCSAPSWSLPSTRRASSTGPAPTSCSCLVTRRGPARSCRCCPVCSVAVGALLGCWLLVRVMRSIAVGDPFAPANVGAPAGGSQRLFGVRVGAGVLLGDGRGTGALLGSVDLGGLDPAVPRWTSPGVPLLAGMVVALLAEAFKGGSRLRDDVDGLV